MNRPADQSVVGRVVVGSDGTAASEHVVLLASDEASQRGTSLCILTVVEPAHDVGRELAMLLELRHRSRRTAELALEAARSLVRSRHPELSVSLGIAPATDDITGDQVMVARDLLEGCELLVIGSRGPKGLPAFVLGSTSGVLLTLADSHVLVVPPATREAGLLRSRSDVVVAVDVTPGADRVLARAAKEARVRSCGLQVVHVATADADDVALHDHLAERLHGVAPDLTNTVQIVHGPVVPQVVRAAAEACLLVIGSRGSLALGGLALESVSHGVLREAETQVLVVRADVTSPTPGGRTAAAATAT